MEELIKNKIFEIIYKKLNLQEIEKQLIEAKIPSKKINTTNDFSIISNYFCLQNDINLNNLTKEEQTTLQQLLEKGAESEINAFLERNMLELCLPKIETSYIYWGPNETKHAAPSDALVIAFHYLEFSPALTLEQKRVIANVANEIQFELAPKINKKIAVIEWNEIPVVIPKMTR